MKGRALASGLCLLALTACGGGGDDGNTNPIGGAGKAVITEENGEDIVGDVAELALESDSLADLTTGSPIPVAGSGLDSLGKLALTPALKLWTERAAKADPIPETTVECELGGSMTFSGEIADPFTLTAGDSFTIAWAACDNGDGEVLEGSFTMIVDAFDGNLLEEVFDMSVTLEVSGFQVTDEVETTTIDGDLSTTFDSTQAPLSTVTLSSTSLTVTTNGVTETLTDYLTTYTEDGSVFPAAFTMSTSGTYASSDISGEATFTTPVTFEGSGDDYPSVGELLVTGADDATVRLIAIDNATVRIEIDVDGDGAVDVTIETSWELATADDEEQELPSI